MCALVFSCPSRLGVSCENAKLHTCIHIALGGFYPLERLSWHFRFSSKSEFFLKVASLSLTYGGGVNYCVLHCVSHHHWLSMVRTSPNEHSVRTLVSKLVRTHSNSLGAHPVAMRTQWRCAPSKRLVRPGLDHLKQSFGCVGRNLCSTLSVYYVTAEFSYKYGM